MNRPRFLFCAPAGQSGKTMITCGILKALVNRRMKVSSFKCGPDYIDPMFHEKVIGTKSANLDLFFSDAKQLQRLFIQNSEGTEISVIEGVMGYYDGLGAATEEASTFKVAEALGAPAVLIINSRGQSLSALATLKGFLDFKAESGIKGVIFNQMSEHVYNLLKPEAEKLGIKPLGFVPKNPAIAVESRHLGLVTPDEIKDLTEKVDNLAAALEKTVDIEGLLALANSAPEPEEPKEEKLPTVPKTKIAVARDEAFCFFYKDNLALLERMGAELEFFSPVHDKALPKGTKGMILPGGYPELYAKELSENLSLRSEIAAALRGGMPCLAECGGFMYLHEELEDLNKNAFPMVGFVEGRVWKTEKLGRFGYIELSGNSDGGIIKKGDKIKGHEFHYYESTNCGAGMTAEKPVTGRKWECVHTEGNLAAGFPHLFYESNPEIILRFLKKCAGKKEDI